MYPCMPLTDKAIKAFKPRNSQYKKADGKGLFLLIHPNGSKYWRFKYLIHNKEKSLSLGVYPEISLLEAREKTIQLRKHLANNLDPSQERKLDKLKSKISMDNSFKSVAEEWHENQKAGWTERHSNYTLSRLEADVLPKIGFRPINEITAPELLLVLRDIEKRGALDISARIRQTCGQIFRYAIATGKAERDIAADLKGALKTRKRGNFKYLQEDELPEFLEALKNYSGDMATKLGLKLLILTFVRTTELRGARWTEINFSDAIWRIPAERMKMRVQHIVPLSRQVLEILEELKPISGYSEFIFPSRSNAKKFISENTLLYAVYRLGYHKQTTVHGFRAMASTILNERGFMPDVIERQLAHSERNKVRASYNHAQYLPQRKEMMQWWADYISDYKKRLESKRDMKVLHFDSLKNVA